MTQEQFFQLPDFIKTPSCDIMHFTGCSMEDALLCVTAGLSVDKSVELIRQVRDMNTSRYQSAHICLMQVIQEYNFENHKVISKELAPLFGDKETEKLNSQQRNAWKQRVHNLMKS